MKKNSLICQLVAFIMACAVALPLTFFGLRWYFDENRLKTELTRSYSAKDFQVLAGQAKEENESLLVYDIQPTGFSFVNAGNLRIDTRFYEDLTVVFAQKHPSQPLLLAVRADSSETPIERPVAYSNQMTNRVLMSDLMPDAGIITDVGLVTNKLISPYLIQSVIFSPKKLSYTEFAYLLADCFAINKQWENWSINTHRSPYWVLIPPKILVLIYFTVVGLFFVAYLRFTRQPMINAWWATLVAAWFALDAHYLVEKTVITKNTYDTFAHLSDDEKDLVLSPEAAKLAQTIKSVLPDDGERKKIRIDFGWEEKGAEYIASERRYLSGKLHYFLQPNIIYTLGVQIPDGIWKKGGFYYVDVGHSKRGVVFDKKKEMLKTGSGRAVAAKLLLNNNDMTIYQVLGDMK